MKKNKMSLTTELDLTREGTAEMTRWCILIALHQSFGIGAARLNKILARAEKLGQESLDVAMTVNERVFRPLAGNSLDIKKHGQTTDGFRPLAGCSFTIPHIESKEKNYTPEKRGWSRKDKS